MAYDPKKKRPTRDSLDAVVDEIFGEEPTETAPKKAAKKAPAATRTKKPSPAKKPSAPKSGATAAKDDVHQAVVFEASFDDETLDNVLPLYPEAEDTPLIMQPQVWIATGVAALIVLFIARSRKKR